ncbi:MAG: heavy metal translocating P-type ATPase [Lachnospiraceae bacterium]|nr:heavy metal translocating P-type ATPase [Lachnospiraceae bacterium]
MRKYNVTGMSCAACQARVEKSVSGLPGVTSCTVSLLTNSMGVEGSASDDEIIRAVEKAGYGASVKENTRDILDDKETPAMKRRLVSSVILLLVLLYFSMGVGMFHFPLPSFIGSDPLRTGIIQLVLTGLIMMINRKFFISGFKSMMHLSPNMDSLIALGSGAAFIYSLGVMLMGSRELYFETAAMILTLVTVGKTLESYSKGRTTDALKSLMKLAPKTANVIRDGREITVDIDEVTVNDIFLVRPGENIPADGIVIEGNSAVNESALTGESVPVDKEPGSKVSAATLNSSGFLKCRATRIGEDTTFSQIIEMVSSAVATKAPVAKLADRISGIFVPAVIATALAVMIIWMALGKDSGYALARGISVLVVSCPCALGLATPVAIMVGNGVGARNGILFKTAQALQETGSVRVIALDKTGTITTGRPSVTDVIPAEGESGEDLIRKAASLEQGSEHPLAVAVMEYAQNENIEPGEVNGFNALPGNGLEGEVSGIKMIGGSLSFVSSRIEIPAKICLEAERLAEYGITPVLFAQEDRVLGVIGIADTIREDSVRAINELKNMGIRTVMLTGDNQKTADAIGHKAKVDEVIAGVLPDQKASAIRRLQAQGKTAMIGDGINDAPALAGADIGIAIGAGTDVAIDAAEVVLMRSSLSDAAAAIRLSRKTLTNIKENLFWALAYNVLLIPLACGLYSRWGLMMSPAWGALAMSCSSIFVVTNALRLNLVDIRDAKNDRPVRRIKEKTISVKEEKKGESMMKKTVKIEGMMCAHCEANVKKALEALDGIKEAVVSHENNEAVIELEKDVEDDVIKKAIEDKDYRFISISG